MLGRKLENKSQATPCKRNWLPHRRHRRLLRGVRRRRRGKRRNHSRRVRRRRVSRSMRKPRTNRSKRKRRISRPGCKRIRCCRRQDLGHNAPIGRRGHRLDGAHNGATLQGLYRPPGSAAAASSYRPPSSTAARRHKRKRCYRHNKQLREQVV